MRWERSHLLSRFTWSSALENAGKRDFKDFSDPKNPYSLCFQDPPTLSPAAQISFFEVWVFFFFFPSTKRKGATRSPELCRRSPGPGSWLRRSRRWQAAFGPARRGAGFSAGAQTGEEEGGGEIGLRKSDFCSVPVEDVKRKPPRQAGGDTVLFALRLSPSASSRVLT